jgi:hypothetical protein
VEIIAKNDTILGLRQNADTDDTNDLILALRGPWTPVTIMT